MPLPFWKTKTLVEMTQVEWESLCDGCGKCCLQKLQDDDTDEVFYTNIACQLLDLESCRCRHYAQRKRLVQNCVVLDANNLDALSWLPSTCTYRLVAEGKELPAWHHLLCNDSAVIHARGHSVRGRVLAERDVDETLWEDYIVSWPQ